MNYDKKVIKNASWIIGVQIVKSVLALIISMLTARYLGPSNYGLINYAASIVSFVTPIMYLGFNNILVQEIINNPGKEGETVGTATCLSFVSALFCIGGIAAFVSVANRGEKETLIVCLLYSALLIFQSADLIMYWYQAKLLSKYSSGVSLCAYIAVSCYKIHLLATGKSIYWFAVSNALDYLIISCLLWTIYRKIGKQKFAFSFDAAKRLFCKSKHYIISNIMIVIFAQTDRVMLKLMVGDAETGYYSAAVYCAGLMSFVFSAIIDSVRPIAFKHKEQSEKLFERDISCLYSIIIYFAIAYSLAMTIFAPLVVNVLYGKEYASSISVLKIIVWYSTASYLGGARDIWVLAEGKQKYLWRLNAFGAIVNIVLNAAFIPIWKSSGAALASVITQFFVNVLFTSIYKPTRRTGQLMLNGCNPKMFFGMIKNIVKRVKFETKNQS